MKYEPNKAKRCLYFGHDFAFQDCDTFITKICLRCGFTQFFFPEDELEKYLPEDEKDE